MTKETMIQLALNEGFSAAALIDTREIVFDASFRPYCEENLCGSYGANYSCPPDCGTPDEMEKRMRTFEHALVVQTRWPITDYRDIKAIKAAKQSHNAGMMRVIHRLKQEGYSGLMGGASCCTLCDRCAILDSLPCAHPDDRFSCLSAYCIHVRKLAEVCGMEYTCQDGSLAFFGLYAF